MSHNIADKINLTCTCKTLNKELISGVLEKEELEARPNLFSSTTMFISQRDFDQMKALIETIEGVISHPDYQSKILHKAPEAAQRNFGPSGVFMGYDFHITKEGVKLIEINTNAGGALLNAKLIKAHSSCCVSLKQDDSIEESFIQMFKNEWSLQRGSAPLKTVAIIDEKPLEQYLYPEFKLFQKLFTEHGIEAFIADPSELQLIDGKLVLNGKIIDLVYNRLTDFYLQTHQTLLKAYTSGEVVMTPNPHHHALYANKNNLEIIRGFKPSDVLLNGIPETIKVNPSLWERRKNLFFKPATGFGSKASYRGDKITKRVWEEILSGDYVAQEIVPPGCRIVDVEGKETDLKTDIRAYVYQGKIQLLAARLYSGQTTNFRTLGGGFSPVVVTPA